VKFTERGSIQLEVRAEPDRESPGKILLLIDVQDTGVGIARDRLDAIFKPFVQADWRRPQEKQGTGLGLAIVKRLTEMLGGTVAVESVPGQGTTFHLRIPRVELAVRESSPVETEEAGAVDFNRLRPATLVVVDDQEMNRQLIAGILQGSHHRLLLGADGTDAVDLVRRQRPDLVLLDIRMPRLDGRQALAQIRAVPGCELLPVIAVTASSQVEDERELRLQFSGYLRKPFTQRKLYDELAAFLPEFAPVTPAFEPLPLSSTVGQSPNWAELNVELRGLEAGEWPLVRDSGAFNEARSFALRIQDLGTKAQCPLLVSYGDALLLAIEGYDAAALEAELQRFPEVISTLERRTEALIAISATPA
jgi:CheY-like chemotaxis protein/anti-sigma regulatory factor (Ser/Thr protein kinase)